MEKRDSFVVYTSWYDNLKKLDAPSKIELYEAMFLYNRGEEVSFSNPVIEALFSFMKEAFDRQYDKYREVCERNKENGKKGGRPKKNEKNDNDTEEKSQKNPENPLVSQETQENPENPVGFSETHSNPLEPKKPDNDNDLDLEEEVENKESSSRKGGTGENPLPSPAPTSEDLRSDYCVLLADGSEYYVLESMVEEYMRQYPDRDIRSYFRSLDFKSHDPNSKSYKRYKRRGITNGISNWILKSMEFEDKNGGGNRRYTGNRERSLEEKCRELERAMIGCL